jgi:hypothetical protein
MATRVESRALPRPSMRVAATLVHHQRQELSLSARHWPSVLLDPNFWRWNDLGLGFIQ